MRSTIAASIILGILFLSTRSHAQDGPSTSVQGFVDVYYAYSFLAHPLRDRAFTTQPLKHNEFNLNLGAIDVRFQREHVRGRVALQTGTYVTSNFAAEPQLLKHVLEASAGTRVGDNVWIDIGIFPSHIGFEGIFSKDNWTYSRSLLADYSPYYEAGVSVTFSASEEVTLRGLALNGWQNINETNDDKAFGTQLQYKPSGSVLLNWSTFVGNEQPDTVASRLRIFNDFYGVFAISEAWSIAAVFDIGFQKQMVGDTYDVWHAASVMVKHTINQEWAIAVRGEYFSDRYGVIIPTGTPNNFQTIGGSVNMDYAPTQALLWRIEARLFSSKDEIYPSASEISKTDGFVVLSAAISL
jgi:hypothetical protein